MRPLLILLALCSFAFAQATLTFTNTAATERPLSVGTRSGWGLGAGTLSDGVATSETSRITYYSNEICDRIQVGFGNFLSRTTQSVNAITIRASIEYGGVLYPLFFGGKRNITLDIGSFILSDPQPSLYLAKGVTYYVRTYVSVASGEKWPRNFRFMNGATEGYAAGVDYTDVLSDCASTGQLFGPIGIYGRQRVATPRCIAILGDSIAVGYSVTTEGLGPMVAAFDGTSLATTYGILVPHLQLGLTAETAAQFAALATRKHRQQLLGYATHAIYQYGINDVRGGAVTLASAQATALANWNMLSSMGIRVWACTLTPNTTSTDSWATTGNQTLANSTGNTVRVGYNDWLRTAPAPLSGILETADTCESARNSGLWKASYTTDGLHPNSTGFAAYKSVVNEALIH